MSVYFAGEPLGLTQVEEWAVVDRWWTEEPWRATYLSLPDGSTWVLRPDGYGWREHEPRAAA